MFASSLCCRVWGKEFTFSCYVRLILLLQLYCLQAGMIEFVGLIKVNVVRGTNLAVRDVVTSDPYVILSLGHQVRPILDFIHIVIAYKVGNYLNSPVVIYFAVCENTSYKEQFESSLEWEPNVVYSRLHSSIKSGKLDECKIFPKSWELTD